MMGTNDGDHVRIPAGRAEAVEDPPGGAVLVIAGLVDRGELGEFVATATRSLLPGITIRFSSVLFVDGIVGVFHVSAIRGRMDVVREIEATGVVAVIRLPDASQLRAVAEALLQGGVRTLEVTMTVPRAVALIEELAASLPPEVLVGAGTVLDAETARQVMLAGARFVVSPVFDRKIIETCHRYDIAVVPGCFTPTEILAAWQAGADVVKVFPATALGPGFLKDVRGPLPHVRLMPTGGVTRENAGEWIRAGAVAIGVGTALVDRRAVADRRFDQIAANARHFIEAVQVARGGARSGV
jgi:2-dehydro-3-deoxyphosphogluconate aldolase/(4S)-4-hydroxy-2-oxoglutarate aldolase